MLVLAAEFAGGVVVDYDIRIDAVALDDPALAVFGVGGKFGFTEVAAVGEWQGAGNADDSTPGAFADEFAEAFFAETIGE